MEEDACLGPEQGLGEQELLRASVDTDGGEAAPGTQPLLTAMLAVCCH